MVMKTEVDIKRKYIPTILIIAVISVGLLFAVYAYNANWKNSPNTPSIIGHTPDEIEGLNTTIADYVESKYFNTSIVDNSNPLFNYINYTLSNGLISINNPSGDGNSGGGGSCQCNMDDVKNYLDNEYFNITYIDERTSLNDYITDIILNERERFDLKNCQNVILSSGGSVNNPYIVSFNVPPICLSDTISRGCYFLIKAQYGNDYYALKKIYFRQSSRIEDGYSVWVAVDANNKRRSRNGPGTSSFLIFDKIVIPSELGGGEIALYDDYSGVETNINKLTLFDSSSYFDGNVTVCEPVYR